MTRWLIELVRQSPNGGWVHTAACLKALTGDNISGSDATSILPLYGLIEEKGDGLAVEAPDGSKPRTNGYWRPTELGRRFVRLEVTVPRKVVTCLGVPERYEDVNDRVNCREALGKKFNYDEIMGRK